MSINFDFVLYIVFFICLVLSGMLSGSETAITSIPKQKVHQLDDTKKNNRIKKAYIPCTLADFLYSCQTTCQPKATITINGTQFVPSVTPKFPPLKTTWC